MSLTIERGIQKLNRSVPPDANKNKRETEEDIIESQKYQIPVKDPLSIRKNLQRSLKKKKNLHTTG